MPYSDAVVVGGGPAGVAAALRAQRLGASVTLIERITEPHAIPGETLHPAMDAIWEQLGVHRAVARQSFPRHRGHWVHTASARTFVPYGEDRSGTWLGVHAWRPRLHRVLLDAIAASGIRVIRTAHVPQSLLAQGRICGVEVAGEPYSAHTTIDATGRARWLSRQLHLRPVQRGPRRIVHYGWVQAPPGSGWSEPVFEQCASGWTWIARVRPRVLAWNTLPREPGGSCRGKPSVLSALRDLTPHRAADVTWRLIAECAGPGCFIAGDAAITLDPASSKGVLHATLSGASAADAAFAPHRGLSAYAVQDLYRDRMRHVFTVETARLDELYASETSAAR